ncbi:MAG: TatD family hydrolase [Desulfosarcina sp.]|nr:TatD family hydrolase [Desulfobacterales bacterium]
MRLFDSHCHLDDASYDQDREAVLARARTAGVEAIMMVGIDIPRSRQAVTLAETHNGIFASVGIHPHDAQGCSEAVLSELQQMAAHPKVKAWGETGLDFNRMYSPRKVQEEWFQRQVDIALELNLPLIFHERDSGGRFLELLQRFDRQSIRGVVHCFSGNPDELEAYLALGLYIGITGIVTMKARGADLRAIVARIPEDRLLVETDAPYLTPAPERNRHRRNEPAFVRTTLLTVAEARGAAPEALADAVWTNTCRLYGIKPSEVQPTER